MGNKYLYLCKTIFISLFILLVLLKDRNLLRSPHMLNIKLQQLYLIAINSSEDDNE